MRVSYHRLDDIRTLAHHREIGKHIHRSEDYNRHLNRKSQVEHHFYTELYNKQADLKRYTNRTTVDIFA